MKRLFLIVVTTFLLFAISGCRRYQPWTYRLSGNGIEITQYNGMSSTVAIPNEIDGLPVISIGYQAFAFNNAIQTITFPDNLQEIGDSAFLNCNNLKKVYFNSFLKTIGIASFMYCANLVDVTIPASVQEIGISAFGYSGIKSITIDENNTSFVVKNQVLFNKDMSNLLLYFGSSNTIYEIPTQVKCISPYAFINNKVLTKIVIPVSVKEIGDRAFQDCINLKDIVLSEGIELIGDFVFLRTPWLDNQTQDYVVIDNRFLIAYHGDSNQLEIPDGIEHFVVNQNLYEPNSELECVNILSIPESLKTISDGVWQNFKFYSFKVNESNSYFSTTGNILYNKSQTVLYRYSTDDKRPAEISNTVQEIGSYAFDHCVVSTINLPESIIQIGAGAFSHCYQLTNISVPKTILTLNPYLFQKCTQLQNIVLPPNLNIIEDYVFSGCNALRKICLSESVRSISSTAFLGCDKIKIIGVPNSYAHQYAQEQKIQFVENS